MLVLLSILHLTKAATGGLQGVQLQSTFSASWEKESLLGHKAIPSGGKPILSHRLQQRLTFP